jgi:hypothetical protein
MSFVTKDSQVELYDLMDRFFNSNFSHIRKICEFYENDHDYAEVKDSVSHYEHERKKISHAVHNRRLQIKLYKVVLDSASTIMENITCISSQVKYRCAEVTT